MEIGDGEDNCFKRFFLRVFVEPLNKLQVERLIPRGYGGVFSAEKSNEIVTVGYHDLPAFSVATRAAATNPDANVSGEHN